jgi:Lrp/AsnC family leucine-responsive transcriptional regulator
MDIDKFDLRILEVLQRNARATMQELASEVGLSATPCWNRVKRMEAAGVIRRYGIKIDQAALGYADTVIVQLTLDSHTDSMIDKFGKALEDIPEVIEAYLVSGDYDYFVRIAVRDTRDYERLLRERLYKIPGIRHSKSSFVLRTLKESDAPLQLREGSHAGSRRGTRPAKTTRR